jgi:hypothetical protein
MSPRFTPLAIFAAAMNTAAWFLPVVHVPGFPPGSGGRNMPGWEVFKTLMPIGDVSFSAPTSTGDWVQSILSLLSPLTNSLFVLVIVLALRATISERGVRRTEVAIWASVALNSYWLATGLSDLRVGYYLWLASFILLALSISDRRRRGFTAPQV